MANNENPLAKNIRDLFTERGVRYEIPVYQRDYAWTEPQIRQLIQDIADYAKEKSDTHYYIGTLIVYERMHGEETVYETIDGQQRLTTLSILLNLLKKEFNEVEWFEKNILSFACRPKSTESLQTLYDGEIDSYSSENVNLNILQGYKDARKALRKILSEYNLDVKYFAKYLGDNVYILRVPVPKDTDLNHYFEIMNSRGEQLEKHEVLKAQCLKNLDEKEQIAFNKIWEAASNMERYVQYGFTTEERDSIFGTDLKTRRMWDCLIKNPDDVYQKLSEQGVSRNEELSLEEIISANRESSAVVQKNSGDEDNVRFNTIINFSNFLLHVLRIQVGMDIPLDDKRLLELFDPYVNIKQTADLDEAKSQAHDFVKEFGYNLLKIKFLYDKYIIKREFSNGKDQWSLKRVRIYKGSENKKSYSFVGTFSEPSNPNVESELNHEILMLLSMFHVSTPTLVYKHWLNGALKWCYEQHGPILADDYKAYLEKMAEAFLRDRFLSKEPLDYFTIIYRNGCKTQNTSNDVLDISKLNVGTDVENFIFNYLDYLLWKDFKTESKSAFNVIGDNDSLKKDPRISNFEYSFRSSVEHYYPQNPIEGKEYRIDDKPLNCFGNLCLISNEKNSRLSNYMPLAKKEHYAASEKIDSIKQRIMMAYEEWDERGIMDTNKKNEIEDHYKKMVKVLLGDESALISKDNLVVVIWNTQNDDFSENVLDELTWAIMNQESNAVTQKFWNGITYISYFFYYPEDDSFDHSCSFEIERMVGGKLRLKEKDLYFPGISNTTPLVSKWLSDENFKQNLLDENFVFLRFSDLNP